MEQYINIKAKNEEGDLLGTFELSIKYNPYKNDSDDDSLEEDIEEDIVDDEEIKEDTDFNYINVILLDEEGSIEDVVLDCSIEDIPSNASIILNNVPVVYEYDNKTPIQFYNGENNVNIMLLEEHKYYLSFEPNKDLPKEFFSDLKIFHTLSNFDKTFFDLYPKTNNGSLSIGSYVGKGFIDIYKENKPVFEIPFEARSRKINYATEYGAMIGDLSKYAQSLIYGPQSPLGQLFIDDEIRDKVTYEDFMLLEYLFKEDNLPSTIEYLSRNLYSALTDTKEEVPTSFASNINPNDLIDVFSNSENLEKSTDTNSIWHKQTKGYVPLRINETKYVDNIDVPENRFYKNFLESIEDLVIKLSEEFKQGYISDQLSIYKETIRAYLSQSYFKDIGVMEYVPLNSQLLQKKEGYRDILQYYLMLELGFRLKWGEVTNEFKGNEKKLFRLFEFWCFFELVEIMEDICDSTLEFYDLFTLSKDNMSLKEGDGVKNPFKITKYEKEVIINLVYNKTFSGFTDNWEDDNKIFTRVKSGDEESYSVHPRPDYSLIINIGEERYIIHFDAKYKLDIKHESFINEDIVKMHAYKDAISDTIGAYVLYPGDKCRLYFEDEEQLGSVGAFPLNPSEDKYVSGKNKDNREVLENFIISMIDKLVQKEMEKEEEKSK